MDSAQQVDNAFFPPFESAGTIDLCMSILKPLTGFSWSLYRWRSLQWRSFLCLPLPRIYERSLELPSVSVEVYRYGQRPLTTHSYYWITQAFQSTSGSISNLVNGINNMKSTCSDTTLLGSFLENHDNPRFPSYTSDLSLAKNAIAFTILADGIPISKSHDVAEISGDFTYAFTVYEGQEQHYSGGGVPNDREAIWLSGYDTTAPLYTFIASVNQIRNQAIFKDSTYLTYKAYPVYSDSSTIVMRKGNTNAQIIGVFSNLGANGASYTLTLPSSDTGFSTNQALVEIISCTTYTTDGSGNLNVAMASGLPRIFYPQAQLSGSGICSTTG